MSFDESGDGIAWRWALALALVALALAWNSARGSADCPTEEADAAIRATEEWRREAACATRRGDWGHALLILQRLAAQAPEDAGLREEIEGVLRQLEGTAGDRGLALSLDRPTWWQALSRSSRGDAWIAVEGGHDTNINSATDLDAIRVPLLNDRQVALNELLAAQRSRFLGLNGGLAADFPIRPGATAYLQGAGAIRYNADRYEYLPHNYRLAAGLEFGNGRVRGAVEAGATERWVARFHAVDHRGILLRIAFSPTWEWMAMATIEDGRTVYPLLASLQTGTRRASLALGHEPTGLRITWHSGKELSTGTIKDSDRDFEGWTVEWRRSIGPGTLRLTAAAEHGTYRVESPLFMTRRRDEGRELGVEYEWSPRRRWYIVPKVLVERNASNIPLMAYSRRQVLVEARREF